MQNPRFGSKIKIPKKHVKIHSTNHLKLFCAKNRCKKHYIFENRDHFENQPSCKGYSPCKILTLGQKLKFQKTCQNSFYRSFRVVLCKKPLQKTLNIREMRPFWKSETCKGYSPCKIPFLGQILKFQKTYKNSFYKSFKVVLCKKTLHKTLKIRDRTPFWKQPSWQGYSPCKILTLSQNLKFQKTCQNSFYKSFRVVLCKKPFPKTLNIREMRPVWKSAITQRL